MDFNLMFCLTGDYSSRQSFEGRSAGFWEPKEYVFWLSSWVNWMDWWTKSRRGSEFKRYGLTDPFGSSMPITLSPALPLEFLLSTVCMGTSLHCFWLCRRRSVFLLPLPWFVSVLVSDFKPDALCWRSIRRQQIKQEDHPLHIFQFRKFGCQQVTFYYALSH